MLLVGGLGSSLCGPLLRLLQCLRDMVDGLSQMSDPEKQRGSFHAFYDQPQPSNTLTAIVLYGP